jgi:hypothetical protein
MPTLLRRRLFAGLIGLAAARPAFAAAPPRLEVWKQRTCGCCAAWVRHLEAAGFPVTVHEVGDTHAVSALAGVPADLHACHTARIGGYAVEGHVPAEAIGRLLAARPAVRGIAVPGMPIGSPGMETPGKAPEPYDVIAFAADGSRQVFLRVRP